MRTLRSEEEEGEGGLGVRRRHAPICRAGGRYYKKEEMSNLGNVYIMEGSAWKPCCNVRPFFFKKMDTGMPSARLFVCR